MSEWVVVSVIVTLVGFAISVTKPIVSLTKSITTLTVEVNGLREDLKEQKDEVHASFVKVWEHNGTQDDMLNDHETRLQLLEKE